MGRGKATCKSKRTWAMLSGRERCASRSGTSVGVGKGRVVVGRRTPLSLVQALLPSNQEMMGQNDQGHVMVPAAPEAQFVVIHAQFSLALGKTGLDRPAACHSRAQTWQAASPEEHCLRKTSILAPLLTH
jgi:hypothetical protein